MVHRKSERKVFVTKADKGEVTLIMNHTDMQEAIEKNCSTKKIYQN